MSKLGTISRGLLQFLAPFLILGGGVAGYLVLASQTKEPPRVPRKVKPLPLVETAPISVNAGSLDIDADGAVVPAREVTLSAEVTGRIVEMSDDARAGRSVKANDILFKIDPRDYELEAERLKQQTLQAKLNVDEVDIETENVDSLIQLAQLDVELASRELKRTTGLVERNVVSQSAFDKAQRAEITARNALRQRENEKKLIKARKARLIAAHQLAQAQHKKAQLSIERCTVKAPFDGVVIEHSVEEGDYVNTGLPLVKLEDTADVEVLCNLEMDEMFWIWQQVGHDPPNAMQSRYQLPSTPVTVSYQIAGRRYTWNGRLDRYDGLGIDEKTRTVPCRVVVSEPRAVLRDGKPAADGPPALVRGMFVRLTIHATTKTGLLDLPERAVQPGNSVWAVRNGRVFELPIHVAQGYPDRVLIEPRADGPRPSDTLVISPVTSLLDGEPVQESPVQ